jgi:hypothetical protein
MSVLSIFSSLKKLFRSGLSPGFYQLGCAPLLDEFVKSQASVFVLEFFSNPWAGPLIGHNSVDSRLVLANGQRHRAQRQAAHSEESLDFVGGHALP